MKRIIKYTIIGALKGFIFYILVYVVLLGVVFTYLVPSMLGELNEELGTEPAELVGYTQWNYNIMAVFVLLSIIGSLLRNVVPYGFVLDGLISIGLLYYSLSLFNFGVIEVDIEEKGIEASLDLSPVMTQLFVAISIIIIGGILVRTDKYRRKKRP